MHYITIQTILHCCSCCCCLCCWQPSLIQCLQTAIEDCLSVNIKTVYSSVISIEIRGQIKLLCAPQNLCKRKTSRCNEHHPQVLISKLSDLNQYFLPGISPASLQSLSSLLIRHFLIFIYNATVYHWTNPLDQFAIHSQFKSILYT